MKLTFKDLKQQKFELNAEPTDTIAQLKERIFKFKDEAKEWDPSLQKLIFSGKILADTLTVESAKLEEKGFIVCMLAKPKAAPAPKPVVAAPATPAKPASTPAAPPAAPAPAASSSAPTSNAPPATPTPAGAAAAPAAFNDPSALAMGAQRETAINNMLEMGFPRDQIDAAMRAAYNNPDRAVEYLMTGIPEHLQQEQRPAAAARPAQAPASGDAAPPTAAAAPAAPAEPENVNLFEAAAAAAAGRQGGASAGAGAGAAGGLQNFDFLRNNPQFQQLRRLVQESPHMLEPILQQVGQGNPQLTSLISQNPEAFLQLLAEGADDEEDLPGQHSIAVTPEEADAINRLCEMGFNRDLVIQAFIACDRNEELTANYLFDNPDQDDDMGGQ